MKFLFRHFEQLVQPFESICRPISSNLVKFIYSNSSKMKLYFMLLGVFSALVASIEVFLFGIIGELVDKITSFDGQDFFSENQGLLFKIFFVLVLLLPLVTFFHTFIYNQTLVGNFPVRMISNVHKSLIRRNLNFFQESSAGKIANSLTQIANSGSIIVLKLLDTFMFAIVFFVSMGVLLASQNPLLLIPVFAWLVAYTAIIFYFAPKLKEWSTTLAKARSDMVGKLVDTYSNITTVKLFSHSRTEIEYADAYMMTYLEAVHGQMRFISKVNLSLWAINVLLISSTVLLSLWLWGNTFITAGAIAAAVGVVLRVYTMSHWIMWELAALFGNMGIVKEGAQLFSTSNLDNLEESGDVIDDPGNIEFREVSFSYPHSPPVFSDLNLTINNGERIGIVGTSGAGKSTLLKLLLGFYKPDSGKIIVGGKDLKSIRFEDLLSKISVVSQEVELLDRTIEENLLYGRSDATKEQMIHATKISGAHDFIEDIRDQNGNEGYKATVGVGGAKLSGGQRQRITLARALLKDSPIILFDEATSALDPELESRLLKNIHREYSKKTFIFITHRLSSLTEMDRIVVIDSGEVTETGTFDELISKSGVFSRLWESQSISNKKREPALET